jgi:hypothetical protein
MVMHIAWKPSGADGTLLLICCAPFGHFSPAQTLSSPFALRNRPRMSKAKKRLLVVTILSSAVLGPAHATSFDGRFVIAQASQTDQEKEKKPPQRPSPPPPQQRQVPPPPQQFTEDDWHTVVQLAHRLVRLRLLRRSSAISISPTDRPSPN